MLHGKKVILRATEREDLRRLWELRRNIDLVQWSEEDWMPDSLASAEQQFEKHLDEDPSGFVIEADGKVIGGIGLYGQERRSGTSSFGMGIFDPAYVSQGYGRDAINVLLDWAFRIQNYRRIWLSVLSNNERAIRAYRAVGFREEARLREHEVFQGQNVDLVKMGIMRTEWESGGGKGESGRAGEGEDVPRMYGGPSVTAPVSAPPTPSPQPPARNLTLRNERMVLRMLERTDLPRWHALMNTVDLVLLGHGQWEPLSLAAREHRMNKRLDNPDRAWFVLEAEGTLIGEIGLHHWSWNRRTGVSEFGIGIYDSAYVGKGYGPEAAALLLDWAFFVQNFRRIWLITTASNERAIRAYQKLGFVEEGRLYQHGYSNGSYQDEVIMGLLRPEWEAARRIGHGE